MSSRQSNQLVLGLLAHSDLLPRRDHRYLAHFGLRIAPIALSLPQALREMEAAEEARKAQELADERKKFAFKARPATVLKKQPFRVRRSGMASVRVA